MQLRVGEILHILENKPILLSGGSLEKQHLLAKQDRLRSEIFGKIIPKIHRSEKYIFDSGQDTDLDTVSAVRETAVALMEMGLFRMPHDLMWIEDPFTNEPNDRTCNFYLVEQIGDIIRLIFMQRYDDSHLKQLFAHKESPKLVYHLHPLEIDLAVATDKFIVCDTDDVDAIHQKTLAESIYSLKKFIVMLNTRGTVIDRVKRHTERTGGDFRRRTYPHSIIRTPIYSEPTGSGGGQSRGKINYCKLVAGYNWGKNTRPREEWRNIASYWRGLGNPIIESKPHLVKSK